MLIKKYVCLITKFALAIFIGSAGITNVHCRPSCASCRKSFPNCDYATGVCDSNCRRAKLCKGEDDLCLATWNWRGKKLVMYTSCFRLPPFSNSSQYKVKCEAEIFNGTRTCLCRGSGCNRNPSEPVMMKQQQADTGREEQKQIQLRQKRNLTDGYYSGEQAATRSTESPVKIERSKAVPMIVWISLAAVLVLLLLVGLIHRLHTCHGHLKKTLLYSTSSKLNQKDFKISLDLNSSLSSEAMVAQGRYSVVWKGYSKNPLVNGSSSKYLREECMKCPNDENMSVTRDCVTLGELVFPGKYSNVWKGRLREQNVAVKIFPVTAVSSWQRELDINSLLSEGHSNIVTLITWNEAQATHRNNDLLWLMMDFYENGSLRDYLKSRCSLLRWKGALEVLSGITSGLAFLHSDCDQYGRRKVPVAHRDLKSTNILVRRDGTCVISDFGLALSLQSIEDESKNIQVGTYRYMSPEELLTTVGLNSSEAFKQMDIYSMALVLWEVISRCEAADSSPEYRMPFEDMVGAEATLDNMVDIVALKNCRPQLPNRATDYEGFELVCQTVRECWDPDPEARLTADCAKARLKELITTE